MIWLSDDVEGKSNRPFDAPGRSGVCTVDPFTEKAAEDVLSCGSFVHTIRGVPMLLPETCRWCRETGLHPILPSGFP